MEKEIQVTDLIPYLPHRPPMVWINRILEVGNDYKGLSGICIVDLDRSSLYVNNGDQLRASSAIEFTAQGFGYLKAAFQVIHKINNPPTKTYLTGVRSCRADFKNLDLKSVSQLQITITTLREMLPISYVKGVVTLPGSSEVLAVAEIQVYVD